MADGVEVDAPVGVLGAAGLQLGAPGAESQDLLLGLVDVIDGHVDVGLLAVLAVGPVRCLVVGGPLEAEEHVAAVTQADPVVLGVTTARILAIGMGSTLGAVQAPRYARASISIIQPV